MNSGNSIDIVGAWRIWFEHATDEVQGGPLEPIISTGAHHLFEIHPVTQVEGIDLLESLKEIVGYDAHDASTAFTSYRKKKCTIIPNPSSNTTTIRTPKAVYNYVESARSRRR